MNYYVLSIIILTVTVIIILCFLYLYHPDTSVVFNKTYEINKQLEVRNPKKELIDYFARNWDNLKVYFINNNNKDCNDIKIPYELEEDFYNKFGDYFGVKSSDSMMETFAFRNYQITFKMEFREICQSLTTLKKYLRDNPDINLNILGKYLELLHNEHFPQAVFISVILDEMVRTCQKYPDLTLYQIAQTNSLLTMKIIDSI
uniref:Uncharacterized protein n=1 Tax=viral metagenome TaxID=1070528 RepID=A0A6C0E7U6_9ZZZZ